MLLIDNLPLAHSEQRAKRQLRAQRNRMDHDLLFLGLFIVVGAVEHAGVLAWLAHQLLAFTGSDTRLAASGTLWASAVLSAIVDNIPFVATMIPLVKTLAPHFGGAAAIQPVWWSLALGACLGGNGTLVGASPNLVAAGLAEKAGVEFSFWKFTASRLPDHARQYRALPALHLVALFLRGNIEARSSIRRFPSRLSRDS